MRPLVAAVLLCLAGTMALASPLPPQPGLAADHALLEKAVRDTRVDTRPPEPSILEWVRFVVGRAVGWVLKAIDPGAGAREVITDVVTWASLAVVATALATLAVALRRLWRRRLRRPDLAGAGFTAGTDLTAGKDPRDAATWWGRLQDALGDGAPDAALAALWWWLATALVGSGADPSWTSRQLLERTGRRDLRRLVGRLDALAYGPVPPGMDAIRHLAHELAESVS
jgi:hypothetical protein